MRTTSSFLLWLAGGLLLLSLATNVYTASEYGRHIDRFRGYSDSMQTVALQRDTLGDLVERLSEREDSLDLLRRELSSLSARFTACTMSTGYPGYYLVINTMDNNFQLRYGDMLVRTGYCGTGKGWVSNDSGIVWDFSTPGGLHYVERKGENPYWYRPDWFWLEQNLRPPEPDEVVMIPETLSYDDQISYYRDSLSSSERLYVARVPGALGHYKIDIGGGVLIHYGVGRGRNVSHGCVRMGGSDLQALYRALPVGAPVIIY